MLPRLLASYFDTHSVCPDYRATIERRWADLCAFARVRQRRKPLSYDLVNAWLEEIGRDLSPATIESYRRVVLALWRHAADEGWAEWPMARKIKRVRVPAPSVQCYTHDQACDLIARAAALTGRLADGTSRSDYWTAIIATAWDTGLRRSDLWRVKASQLHGDVLETISSKTGQRSYHRLYASTVKRILSLGRANGTPIFAWPHDPKTFSNHFQEICQGRGSFKWLRRSSGSYVEAAQPGAGPKHLGHANPATFYRHYDSRAVSVSSVMPPELG